MSHFFARCACISRMSVCFLTRAKRLHFSHVRVFADSRNVQKRATKSDTSGHCLEDRSSRSSDGWWVSYIVDDCLQWQIAQKSSN